MTMAGQLSCRSLRLQVKMSTSQRLIGREEGNALAKLREILGRNEEGGRSGGECGEHVWPGGMRRSLFLASVEVRERTRFADSGDS